MIVRRDCTASLAAREMAISGSRCAPEPAKLTPSLDHATKRRNTDVARLIPDRRLESCTLELCDEVARRTCDGREIDLPSKLLIVRQHLETCGGIALDHFAECMTRCF